MKKANTLFVICSFGLCVLVTSCSAPAPPPSLPDALLSRPEDIIKIPSLPPCACEDTSFVDLSSQMPPVQNQGNINNCVGWSMGYACRSYYHRMISNTAYYKDDRMDSANLVSPFYVYNALRNGKNSGINMLKAIQFLRDKGSCTWNLSDSLTSDMKTTETPITDSVMNALRICTFSRVGYDTTGIPLDEIRNALKCYDPVLIAVPYDVAYFRGAYNGSDRALWDTISEASSFHAVVIVGYDDTHRRFKFMNSNGATWGDKGYGYLSYKIAEKVIREAYVLRPKTPMYTLGKNTQIAIETSLGLPPGKNPDNLIDSIIVRSLSLQIDSQDKSRITVSVHPDHKLMTQILKAADDKMKIYVRLFTIDSVGKAHPLLNKDATNKLGNGQLAYAANIHSYGNEKTWSADISYQTLGEVRGKLRAEPVLYVGKEAIAAGRPVDFDYK